MDTISSYYERQQQQREIAKFPTFWPIYTTVFGKFDASKMIAAASGNCEHQQNVLVPSTHPLAKRRHVTFAETLRYEHVVLRAGTHLRFQMMTEANKAGKALRAKVEVSSYDALCKMVQVGMGVGISPAGNAELYRLPGTRTLKLDEA